MPGIHPPDGDIRKTADPGGLTTEVVAGMTRRGQEGSVSVPARPVIEIMLDEHGRGSVDGRPVPIDDPDDPQASLLAEAVRQAAKLSRPVRVRALDPDGVWHLAAHPDGTV